METSLRTKLPPFVYRERTRHGRMVCYFRRGKGSRTRLPEYGSEGFQDAYNAALTQGAPPPDPKRKARAGSLAWLIARYRESSHYLALSMATRKQRDNIFKHVVEVSGHVAAELVTRKKIMEGREKRASTPAQSRNFLDAMRGLFKWAETAEMVKSNPTIGVENPPRPKGAGFAAWNDDDVAAYEAHWPAGTKERVWLHVLLYTGLRRGDAVRIGRQHVRNGIATIRTEKSRGIVEVDITILPPLAETLAAGKTGDLAFIVGADGRPLTKETFGNYFREACNAAGIRKSAHGVRKLSATRVAEAGATVAELEAMFGWNGGTMASLYTKSANRKRLSASGAGKIIASIG
jgi:integrase